MKVKIDGKEFRVEDAQQLAEEADFYFPDEEIAAQEAEKAIGCLKEADEHLRAAEFESPQLLQQPAACSRKSLKQEVAFLAEVIGIVKTRNEKRKK